MHPTVRTGAHAESGILTESPHALGDVQSAAECQRYCAATPRCAHFSYVSDGAFLQDYGTLGNTCTLKGASSDSSGTPKQTILDGAFTWGSKPQAIAK